MQVEIISNKNHSPKQLEQNIICLNTYHTVNLPDSFTSNYSASIAFKGNISNSFTSKLLKFIRGTTNKPALDIPEVAQALSSEATELVEITYKSVATKLNNQLAYFRKNDLERIINSFAPNDRELATLSLAHMSQWGKFQSLNTLTSNLAKENKVLYTEGENTLATSLEYLKHKGSFIDLGIEKIENYTEIKNNGIIIVDGFFLNRLSKDKKLVNFLKRNSGIQLCYPDGWIHGVNPFNQSSANEIVNITTNVLEKAKKYITKNKMSPEEAISSALNEPVISQLEKLGLKDRVKIISGEKISKDKISLDAIAKQFEHREINAEDLQKHIDTELPKEYRQLMLSAIDKESVIFDSRKISLMMQEQHKKILELAKQKGIPSENIFYFVSRADKSYGIIAQQYQATNKIPVCQFINRREELPKTGAQLIVFLDDYAGSGASINNAAMGFTRYGSDNVVLAPLVSTAYAQKKFADFNYIPARTINTFKASDFCKSQSEDNLKLLEKVFVGNEGINSDSSITFPHMAPDNNNVFFNEFIAPHYLLNGNGAKFDTFHWQEIKNNILTGNFYPNINT